METSRINASRNRKPDQLQTAGAHMRFAWETLGGKRAGPRTGAGTVGRIGHSSFVEQAQQTSRKLLANRLRWSMVASLPWKCRIHRFRTGGIAVASRGEDRTEDVAMSAWTWVDAPDLFEEKGLLRRLQANNDALDSLRQALDAEDHDFARFSTRITIGPAGDLFEPSDL
ncbi:hypothetical protein [Jiella sonneratiae]|uniref:Uncharacterized protein n=1 Tax=Jiella sonneratiae TaxID=2816856 RepID=A0ABS3JA84_9HYPH|nr:hypothetical protein [Jiella sonneratiae]MBO0906589.1 hypothetical protein [Jiella sonneratiae]